MAKTYQVIEHASRGATYQHAEGTYTVYEIGTYPRSSVLAGQQSRTFLDSFEGPTALADAKKAYPKARLSGSTYREPSLNHLPDPEGPDPYEDNEDAARDI